MNQGDFLPTFRCDQRITRTQGPRFLNSSWGIQGISPRRAGLCAFLRAVTRMCAKVSLTDVQAIVREALPRLLPAFPEAKAAFFFLLQFRGRMRRIMPSVVRAVRQRVYQGVRKRFIVEVSIPGCIVS